MYVSVSEFKDSIWFQDLSDYFTDDTQISGFLDEICGLIDLHCGRTFTTGVYTDEFVGRDSGTYFTRIFPLNDITSITYQIFDKYPALSSQAVYTASPTSSGTLDSTNYFYKQSGIIKSGVVFRSNSLWTVTYNAGYTSVPQAVKTATMMLAKMMVESNDVGNLAWSDGAAVATFKFGKYSESSTTYYCQNAEEV
jgi:hypothetical protein